MARVGKFPSRIVLELTPLCNLSCSMCPRHYIKGTDGYMSEELFKRLVDEVILENKKAVLLPFWRGESCLHPKFNSLLRYALEKKMKIHLSTNGHYIDKEYCEIFYQCEFLTFSVHTSIGFKNAKTIIANKPKWCQTIFQISFVDSERTTHKYLKYSIENFHFLGLDSIRLYSEHTLQGEFGKSQQKAIGDRKFCPKLMHTFVVSSDGYFSRCNHIWHTQKEYNLLHHSIKDVWNSSVMDTIRCEYPDRLCLPCDQWNGHTCGEVWRKSSSGILHKKFI